MYCRAVVLFLGICVVQWPAKLQQGTDDITRLLHETSLETVMHLHVDQEVAVAQRELSTRYPQPPCLRCDPYRHARLLDGPFTSGCLSHIASLDDSFRKIRRERKNMHNATCCSIRHCMSESNFNCLNDYFCFVFCVGHMVSLQVSSLPPRLDREGCVGDLEGPTRKPRRAGVFGAHSDT